MHVSVKIKYAPIFVLTGFRFKIRCHIILKEKYLFSKFLIFIIHFFKRYYAF